MLVEIFDEAAYGSGGNPESLNNGVRSIKGSPGEDASRAELKAG